MAQLDGLHPPSGAEEGLEPPEPHTDSPGGFKLKVARRPGVVSLLALHVLGFLQGCGLYISEVPGSLTKIKEPKEPARAAQTETQDKPNVQVRPVEPEYKDPLDVITLGIHSDSSGLFLTQLNILKAIPRSTEVNIIVGDEGHISRIKEKLPAHLLDRVTFFLARHYPIVWVQDISEGPIFPDDKLAKSLTCPGAYTSLLPYCDAIELPVYFEGGNLCLAELHGKTFVIMGADGFIFHNCLSERIGRSPITLDEYKQEIKRGFRCDEVLILGETSGGEFVEQPTWLFHLDLCLLPIAPGKIAILDPFRLEAPVAPKKFPGYEDVSWPALAKIEIAAGNHPPLSLEVLKIIKKYEGFAQQERAALAIPLVKDFLLAIRAQLQAAGFEFVDCVTTWEAVMNFQSPLNGILFGKNFILPIYPDREGSYDHFPNHENGKILAGAGLVVIPVEEPAAFKLRGNLHCLTCRLDLNPGKPAAGRGHR